MYKVKNSELSEQNVKLMVSLTNSKSSQDVLGQQLSEAIALGSYELKSDDAATNAVISRHGAKSFPNFQVSTSKKL